MNPLPFERSELDALAAEVLALSGLSRARLDDAAVELSIGIDLCCGGPDLDPDEALDPYDEFQGFVRNPGLDYENVEGSEIVDLSRRQKTLAVAWHYVDMPASLIDPDRPHRGFVEPPDRHANAQDCDSPLAS